MLCPCFHLCLRYCLCSDNVFGYIVVEVAVCTIYKNVIFVAAFSISTSSWSFILSCSTHTSSVRSVLSRFCSLQLCVVVVYFNSFTYISLQIIAIVEAFGKGNAWLS